MANVHRARVALEKASNSWCCRHRRRRHHCAPAPIFGAPREGALSWRGLLAAPVGPIRTMAQAMGTEFYKFGAYKIRPSEVFYSTDLSYAMVNLRPLVPGRTLLTFFNELYLRFPIL